MISTPTLPEPMRDTACFDERQWFVGDCSFTTEADAREAIRLAYKFGAKMERVFVRKMQVALDEIC